MKAGKRRRVSGSVAIYFAAVTAGFILVTGLLIDYARIATFRKQAELAVKSGARSVLSSYDPSVYEQYGLFVRGGDSADDIFNQVLQGNSEPEGDGTFRLLDMKWSDTGVMESRPLASHDVFRRQVTEEMKIKAPVDLTLELLSKFKGLTSVIKETQESVDLLEQMRKAYDEREAALDAAFKAQKEAGEKLAAALGDQVPNPPVPLSGTETADRPQTVVDAALMYDDYVAKRESDRSRAEEHSLAVQAWQQRKQQAESKGDDFDEPYPSGGEPQYSRQIAAYESGVRELSGTIAERSEEALQAAEQRLEEARSSLADAEAANERMRDIASRAESVKAPEQGTEADGGSNLEGDPAGSIRQWRQTAGELVLDETFFSEYTQELNAQSGDGEAKTAEAAGFASLASSAPGTSGQGSALRAEADKLQTQESGYRMKYGPGGSIILQRQETLEAHRSGDGERKGLEREAKQKWSGAASFLGSLTGASGSEEDKEAFATLARLAKENLEWNQAEAEEVEQSRAALPEEGRDQALSSASGWLGALGDALAAGRDNLYLSEYTISRFTHTEPAEIKEMLEGGTEDVTKPDKQQTEFILYGLNNPSGNIAAAYGEIFAFRLAIRTMEGLVESAKYGNPLVVLAAALVYAIENAVADMTSLLNRGSIPLSKYASSVQTTYTDYLRLFMLLHGGSAGQIARSIAVMESATGLAFERLYTYVSGEAAASLRLWFFPGIVKVVGRTGNWGGKVTGDRYEVNYQADDAYQ
ncbi:hypothetical protein [Cohnella zeiphila]|uniref:Uncharacterized protein n=1 Tax=Cohnella zeiphila TaxID=2761120 RepID=A0A7X0VUH7_9BACL|nr:hypothetical protein [Cohnella zeiphila]MBB6730971.1 hypothetical protein [Cohnella zeiphila]